MDEKYKQFENFNFDTNKDWKSYYKKISPAPPKSKLIFFKKKFYKEKIDPKFDPNYDPKNKSSSQENDNNDNNNNSTYTYEQVLENYKSALALCKPLNNTQLKTTETLSLITFLISLFLQYNPIHFAIFAFLIRTINIVGIPEFNLDYLQAFSMNDSFHSFIYSLQCLVDDFNYYMSLPLIISAAVAICENLCFFTENKLILANFIRKRKNRLLQDQAYVEIAIGFLMIVGIYFKINTIKMPIIYWQLIRVKYMINPYGKRAFMVLDEKTDEFVESKYCPRILGAIINEFQYLFNALGNMNFKEGEEQNEDTEEENKNEKEEKSDNLSKVKVKK